MKRHYIACFFFVLLFYLFIYFAIGYKKNRFLTRHDGCTQYDARNKDLHFQIISVNVEIKRVLSLKGQLTRTGSSPSAVGYPSKVSDVLETH